MIEADLIQQFSWVIPVCLFLPFDGQAGSHRFVRRIGTDPVSSHRACMNAQQFLQLET
jgi:hypothetical protein